MFQFSQKDKEDVNKSKTLNKTLKSIKKENRYFNY